MCDCAPSPPLPIFSSYKFGIPARIPEICSNLRPSGRRTRAVSTRIRSNPDEISRSSSGEKEIPKTSFEFLELKRELEKEEESELKKRVSNKEKEEEELEELLLSPPRKRVGGRRRQVMRRSSLLAKQVISVQSARSLGFISQLWVDPKSWVVVAVEVRPNLLSGDIDKFLLEDITQVGDVVLVQDETVMENELKTTVLDTLVGYNVVTSRRRNVGKVRGYTFNINSGTVESLELDSFGFSMVPASLVSTYCLFVEDVLEVASDTVIVQEGAVSRVQRLTKCLPASAATALSSSPHRRRPSSSEPFLLELKTYPSSASGRRSRKKSRPPRRSPARGKLGISCWTIENMAFFLL